MLLLLVFRAEKKLQFVKIFAMQMYCHKSGMFFLKVLLVLSYCRTVVNMAAGGASIDVSVDLAVVAPALPCLHKAAAAVCAASDVWLNKTAGKVAADGKYIVASLAPHDSAFLIFE